MRIYGNSAFATRKDQRSAGSSIRIAGDAGRLAGKRDNGGRGCSTTGCRAANGRRVGFLDRTSGLVPVCLPLAVCRAPPAVGTAIRMRLSPDGGIGFG
jgi:hypothetical protein